MSEERQHEQEAIEHGATGPTARKHIIQVFLILSVITTVEFIIAFSVHRGMLRNSTFIIMTLVKAFYIVGEFMHLRHEVKRMMYILLFPMLFVGWLVLALLTEGNFIFYGWFQ